MDPHLLIVDDDERIRSLLQQFLIQSDYLVSVSYTHLTLPTTPYV